MTHVSVTLKLKFKKILTCPFFQIPKKFHLPIFFLFPKIFTCPFFSNSKKILRCPIFQIPKNIYLPLCSNFKKYSPVQAVLLPACLWPPLLPESSHLVFPIKRCPKIEIEPTKCKKSDFTIYNATKTY